MGQRAIRNWISRHSYHSVKPTVKNKKLQNRVPVLPPYYGIIRPLHAPRSFPLSWIALLGFSLPLPWSVPTFHTNAQTTLVPTLRRVPPRPYAGPPAADLGAAPRLPF